MSGSVGVAWISKFRTVDKLSRFEGLVNHVRGEVNFTNKLNLVKTLRRSDSRVSSPIVVHPNSIPRTYDLNSTPERRRLIMESNESDMWICKPYSLNRGRGIQIIASNKELIDFVMRIDRDPIYWPRNLLVQNYIKNPLLLDDRKFDIRSYMVIVSTDPLLVLHDPGYVRLSLKKYKPDSEAVAVHLTNQCVQMRENEYESEKEKTIWTLDQLNDYLNQTYKNKHKGYVKDWAKGILQRLQINILKKVILGVRGKIGRTDGSFGLYGCDFLVDENFNVSLIEINLGPALMTNTSVLDRVIPRVLKQTIHIAAECYDKKRLGMKYRPFLNETTMQEVYCEPFSVRTEFPRPYTIEEYVKRVQIIGKYAINLKQAAIENYLKTERFAQFRR